MDEGEQEEQGGQDKEPRTGHRTTQGAGALHAAGVFQKHQFVNSLLGACPTLTGLLRRTIRDHLRRSRPEKILTVFQRIHLRFFQACGLASGRTSFASSRTAMSDRLLAGCEKTIVARESFDGSHVWHNRRHSRRIAGRGVRGSRFSERRTPNFEFRTSDRARRQSAKVFPAI